MELQQIGLSHPRVKQVLDIQHNGAPNRERLLVAEGLWAQRLVLSAGVSVRTFLWCPELAHSTEAGQRAEQLADLAMRRTGSRPRRWSGSASAASRTGCCRWCGSRS